MIGIQQARWLLKRAMETQGPDFVYIVRDDAYNVRDDFAQLYMYRPLKRHEVGNPDDPRCKTGCLVGVALDLAGEDWHREQKTTIDELWLSHTDRLSHDAARYFRQAQFAQDGGLTWGVAVARAELWFYETLEFEERSVNA